MWNLLRRASFIYLSSFTRLVVRAAEQGIEKIHFTPTVVQSRVRALVLSLIPPDNYQLIDQDIFNVDSSRLGVEEAANKPGGAMY